MIAIMALPLDFRALIEGDSLSQFPFHSPAAVYICFYVEHFQKGHIGFSSKNNKISEKKTHKGESEMAISRILLS